MVKPMYPNWWWLASPYVDAYEHGQWVKDVHLPISFEEFETKMVCQARTWGETGLGSAVLRGMSTPTDDEGNLVLAIGMWGDKSWVVIPTLGSKWYEIDYILVEFKWPQHWNVT